MVFPAQSAARMQFFVIQWHYISRQQFLFIFKQFNLYFSIWCMATYHPHVISVFFVGVVLNAITAIFN